MRNYLLKVTEFFKSESGQRVYSWICQAGWILLEVFVVYVISNLPLFLLALENGNVWESYLSILDNELYNGQLFVLSCALLAPVVYWIIRNMREKPSRCAILFASVLILFILSMYVFYGQRTFQSISYLQIYLVSFATWILSLLFNVFPPARRRGFSAIAAEAEGEFLEKTRAAKEN